MHLHVNFEDVNDWKSRMMMELAHGRLLHISGFTHDVRRAEIEGHFRANGVKSCKFVWPEKMGFQTSPWCWLNFEHETQSIAALRALNGGAFCGRTIHAMVPDGATLRTQFTAATHLRSLSGVLPEPELGIWSEECQAAISKLLDEFPSF